jgi:RNA polymerase sigma factor (sigma-70 family)
LQKLIINKNISDEELIKILQQDGNMRYFSLLTDRYEKFIYYKCYSFVKSTEIAKDLTQEVLIKIFMQLKNFRSEAKFTTWLYTIVHHSCIDYLRKSKVNIFETLSEKLSEEVEEIIEGEGWAEDVPNKMLEQMLLMITPDERMLLMLKYKEKHSIKDIQKTLNLSESAIKMRLKRAKDKLHNIYKSHSKRDLPLLK